MTIEEKVAAEVKRRGIKVTAMAEATNISYSILQPCLKSRRPLRADEFLAVCDFLSVDPRIFKPIQDTAADPHDKQAG